MILDPNKLPRDMDGFLRWLKKEFDKVPKGEMPAYYTPRPIDLIVIDIELLRERRLLKPEPVIFLVLHELHHAIHPKSSTEDQAWDWSRKMLKLLTTRGYTSRTYKKRSEDLISTRTKKIPAHTAKNRHSKNLR